MSRKREKAVRWYMALLVTSAGNVVLLAADPTFRVRYVTSDVVYLDGGRSAGLAEGFKLTVKRLKPGEAEMAALTVGEVSVVSLASNSAVCEIKSKVVDFLVGDVAYLASQDAEAARLFRASKSAHKYAQVVSFTDGDPIEEEAREYLPRPPLPEINRIRGRIGFEYNTIHDHDARAVFRNVSTQNGAILRADMTRIGGTYWNFTGYWRGRLNSRTSGGRETLNDVLNRTYQIGMYYNNPVSRYVAGFGRLLVPWASSLSTIDGGYLGLRLGRRVTTGIFAGSTPDPTAWNYNPDRQIAGVFTSFDAGSFENLRYTSTVGVALTRLRWKAERQFAFFENSILFRRSFSIYHNLEADQLVRGRLGNTESGPVVSRSFLTVRFQPHRVVSFDVNHNYFRNVPTFDARLIGIGLLDRLLFQGLSGGVRLDLPYRIGLYTSIGRNEREGDGRPSWNNMYGLTLGNLARTGVRLDLRHSRFNSLIGTGRYDTVTITREFGEQFRIEVQGGEQTVRSLLTDEQRTRFISSTLDWFVGRHYFVGGGLTIYRGLIQNYDQIAFYLGYRF